MYNRDFIKNERLKADLAALKDYCPQQYFAVEKCQAPLHTKCKNERVHVDRYLYPCIHYFTGNCKYGMNCHFSHHIRREISRPEPNKDTCKKLYYENNCPAGGKCKFSHDLKQYPCYYNTISKCRFSPQDCRYSHDKLIEAPLVCFFDLMKGCNKSPEECSNTHLAENNAAKYLSYDGPV